MTAPIVKTNIYMNYYLGNFGVSLDVCSNFGDLSRVRSIPSKIFFQRLVFCFLFFNLPLTTTSVSSLEKALSAANTNRASNLRIQLTGGSLAVSPQLP